MGSFSAEDLRRARNLPIYTSDGEQIGHVGEFWVDDSGQPEWLKVGHGFLNSEAFFVPVQGAELREDALHVPYARADVEGTPELKGEDFTPEYERDLYGAYRLEQPSVTRSEEELSVGKQQVDAGSVRLRKWVETEPVAMDVELQRETARVVREPIDEPVDGAAIGEDEVEVPLTAERAVVSKQTVAKERIGVEKDVVAERQTVEDEVRKERVELEGQ